MLFVRKDTERAMDAKELLENEIMEKVQEQMMSSKATNHFSQLAAKLRRRRTDLVRCLLRRGRGRSQAAPSLWFAVCN